MPFVFTYLLKLSVSLAVVFLFYQLVLRKLTFYNWNRWYLLGYTLLALFIPFINVSPVLQQNEWADTPLLQWVPVLDPSNPATNDIAVAPTASGLSAWDIALFVFIGGAAVMLVRLLVQLISFRRMLRKAQFVSGDDMKLYQVNESIIPFSFGNSIFINRELHTPQELEEIIRHEFVHVKQYHSIDIIWGELLCLFNWYNPFAWLLKTSIRQNLEFIADNKVLQNGVNRKQYQYLLLKVIGNNQFSIANQFNFSSLKKRIAMMNKIKSAKVHLLRFLFVLPLLAVLLVSFREKIGDLLTPDKQEQTVSPTPIDQTIAKTDVMYIAGKILDEITYEPKKGIAVKLLINDKLVKTLKTDEEGYYYYADKLANYKGQRVLYEVRIEDPLYYRGEHGTSAKDSVTEGLYHTIFLASKKIKSRTIGYDLSIPTSGIVEASDPAAYIHEKINEGTQNRIARNKEEKKLTAEFLQQFPVRTEWYTEYKGYLFAKSGKWMGSVNNIKFYLVDDPVDYKAVNEYFRNVTDINEIRSGASWRDGEGWTMMAFDTDQYNKPAPPSSMMTKKNVTKLTVNEFIYLPLEGNAVYVNGKRRSTKGMIGWMLGKPGERKKNHFTIRQKDIVNVYHFKNELAKYYDPKINDVYWVELRTGEPMPSPIRFSAYIDTVPTPNSKGYYIEIADDNGNCMVIVRDKNKKEIARVSLTDWTAKEEYYEKLYGEIPPPLPPSPPDPPTPPIKTTPPSASVPSMKPPVAMPPMVPEPSKPVKPPVAPKEKQKQVTTYNNPGRLKGVESIYKTMTFTVNNIEWLHNVKLLKIDGKAIIDDGARTAVNLEGSFNGLDKETAPLIIIDGKETLITKDFKTKKGGQYKVCLLDKAEGAKKYGNKGKNGAIEIYTIMDVGPNKPSPKPTLIFNPYDFNKDPKKKDDC